jgi:predicted MFS family arabinose efflux permease
MQIMKQHSEVVSHWKVLTGCFLGLGCGVSSIWFYSMGLFLKPLATEFGWGRGSASIGPLVGILTLGFVSPFIGMLLDRYRVQRLALLSLLGLACGFAFLGQFTQGIVGFLCLTALLALLASASSPISFTRILVNTFSRQRGLALGLAMTGTGIGAMITPLLVTHLVVTMGWRTAYLALSLLVLAASPVIFILLREVPIDTRNMDDERSGHARAAVYMTPHFIRLGLIFLFCSLAVFGTVVHLVPMLTDRGLSPADAALFASALGVAVIAGRVTTGLLLDRFEANLLTATLLLLSGLGMWLLSIGSPVCTVIGTFFAGFAIGAELDLAAYLISKTFPLRRYSAAFGGIYACVSIGGGGGPALAGYMYDRSGNYALWLACAGVFLAISAGLALLWKVPIPDVVAGDIAKTGGAGG